MASLLERMNVSTGPVRPKRPSSRSSLPYARPPKGDVEGQWSHDLYTGDKLAARMNIDVGPPKINSAQLRKAVQAATGQSGINIKGAGQPLASANVVDVRGLVQGTTPDDVQAIFRACGHVVSAKKMPGNDELCIRITYKEASAAASAVKKFDKQPADGKVLSVTIVGASSQGNTLGGRLGGKDGLGLVRQEGSVDVLIDSSEGGSKMRSDSLINSDRAQVLTAPPGADPKDYAPTSGRGRGRGRGRGGRRGNGGNKRGGLSSRMDID